MVLLREGGPGSPFRASTHVVGAALAMGLQSNTWSHSPNETDREKPAEDDNGNKSLLLAATGNTLQSWDAVAGVEAGASDDDKVSQPHHPSSAAEEEKPAASEPEHQQQQRQEADPPLPPPGKDPKKAKHTRTKKTSARLVSRSYEEQPTRRSNEARQQRRVSSKGAARMGSRLLAQNSSRRLTNPSENEQYNYTKPTVSFAKSTGPTAVSVVKKMTQSDKNIRMRRLFDDTDVDGNGTLNLKEIRELCKKLGDRMSTIVLDEAFTRMDPEHTGRVDFDAFQKWWRLKEDMHRYVVRSFRVNSSPCSRATLVLSGVSALPPSLAV